MFLEYAKYSEVHSNKLLEIWYLAKKIFKQPNPIVYMQDFVFFFIVPVMDAYNLSFSPNKIYLRKDGIKRSKEIFIISYCTWSLEYLVWNKSDAITVFSFINVWTKLPSKASELFSIKVWLLHCVVWPNMDFFVLNHFFPSNDVTSIYFSLLSFSLNYALWLSVIMSSNVC